MAKFKTRARALDMLGRQQIAGIPTAISELFKNAHDAYADRVEVDFYLSDRLFVLRDDGVGMTEEEFLSRWLTLGTESKLKGAKNPPPIDSSKDSRKLLGEKGVGRLAIAIIGPQVMVLSRAERNGQLHDLVATFIHWGLFEAPGVDLDDIEIPVRTFSEGTLPSSDDLLSMVAECSATLERIGDTYEPAQYERIKEELASVSFDPQQIDGYVNELSLKENRGTHFIIPGASELLVEDLEMNGYNASGSVPNLYRMLRGFSNTMTPGHIPPVLKTAFRYYKVDDFCEDILEDRKFFTENEFINADHQIVGEFDDYGQFSGNVTVYGNATSNHIISWKNSLGNATRCGSFKISVAVVQGIARQSTLPAQEYAEIVNKLNRFGGLYIYKDGIRILPYGNTDFDWLNFEKKRSLKADHYYFSHRRMFGVVDISTDSNSTLREKAGREGFAENAAYRDLKQILENFFEQLAADFFRKDAADDYYQQTKSEFDRLAQVEKLRSKMTSKRKNVFEKSLASFFERYDDKEPQKLIAELIAKTTKDLNSVVKLSDVVEARARLNFLEAEVRQAFSIISSTYEVSKPRGIGLSKTTSREWEKYLAFNEQIQCEVIRPAQQLILQDILEQSKKANLSFDRKASLANLVAEQSRIIKSSTSKEKKVTEELAKEVQKEVVASAKKSLLKVNNAVAQVEADIARLDYSILDDANFVETRCRIETEFEMVHQAERDYLKNIQDQLEAITLDDSPSQLDQMEAIEQKAIALEERASSDLQLTQLGMAIEVINHEFDASIRSTRNFIKRLKSWADMNEGLVEVYHGIRSSFDHLDGYLTLFTPLHRRLQRKKIIIQGSDIAKFLNDLFAERLKRYDVQVNTTSNFNRARIDGYPSSFYPVFINLVDNAIFWLEDQNRKEIILDAVNDVLIVKDSGPGIRLSDHDSIFELGFSRKPGGRGMGLHISRDVLKEAGYQLELVSSDVGAEFHIRPVAENEGER